MTEKLFYKDSHLSEFEAEVISCRPADGGMYEIELDRTAFFPRAADSMRIQAGSERQRCSMSGKKAEGSYILQTDRWNREAA